MWKRWAFVGMIMAWTATLTAQESGYRPYEYFIRFENYSVNEGLSQSSGRAIIQDSRGFIWIGTHDGLNKFDGHKFKVYNTIAGDTNSLSDNFILSLLEDRQGLLWIGTNGGGVSHFDPQRENFTHYRNQQGEYSSLSNNFINAILEDRQGNLWFATNQGLNRFNPEDDSFTRYLMDSTQTPSSIIYALFEDSQGRFWLGSRGGGLLQFDPLAGRIIRQYRAGNDSIGGNTINTILEDHLGNLWFGGEECPLTRMDPSGKFRVFHNDPNDISSISENAIYSLYETRIGKPRLWIGTLRNGLNLYIPESQSFVRYHNDPNDPFSLSNNIIFSMESSQDGTMWLGTGGGGITKFSLRSNKFHTFRNPEGGVSNFFWCIRPYDDHQVLLGTQNSGLYFFDRKLQTFRPWPFDAKHPEESLSYDVYTLHKDRKGALWIGTANAGLYRIDEEKNLYEHFLAHPDNDNTLASNWVRSIFEESDSCLWIGTTLGLSRYNPLRRTFTNYYPIPGDSTSLSYPTIQGLLLDSRGDLWVGTYGGGLNKLNRTTGTFKRYRHHPKDPHSLSNDRVRVIYEDADSVLWIGTDHGINRYNREKDHFDAFTMAHGLPNNVIYSILPDKHGHFWLSTNLGLSVFNPADTSFKNYDVQDGLQSNEFNTGAYYLAENGEMYFGGIDGFNIFHPDSIRDNPYVPPVSITEFQLFNKPVDPGLSSILDQCISTTEEIQLKHNQNFLSFEFAAFNYINSDKNQYRYKMEGLDDEWVEAGNRRFANYPDMKPGTYRFRVMGSNNDGIWNETGESLRITITPPWWESTLALILYGLTGLLLIFWYIRAKTSRLAREKRILEDQVRMRTMEIANQKEEIEAQRDSLEELNAAKDKLFTIIGHDLKTPLTSLLSLSHTLKANLSHLTQKEVQTAISSVDHSAQNLFKLLENLLEWTRAQTNRTPIHRRHFALNDVILENLNYLKSQAWDKKIRLQHQVPEPISVYADRNMISTVIRNLVNNAIKFTQQGGRVKIGAHRKNQETIIQVADNGIGIPPRKRENLFRIDSARSTDGTNKEKGTGLGLLLCKDFVEKNGGTIWADSTPGKGSTFYFTVPLSPYQKETP